MTANEFCAFLNDEGCDTTADSFYDDLLMSSTSSQYCIIRQNISVVQDSSNSITFIGDADGDISSDYHAYEVVQGADSFIVDAVISETVQNNFNAWSCNPTAQELCTYINDKLTSTGQDYCQNLMASYPLSSIFQQADHLLMPFGVNGINCFSGCATMTTSFTSQAPPFGEQGPIITASDFAEAIDDGNNANILVPVNGSSPLQYSVASGKEYSRPTTLHSGPVQYPLP